MCNLTSLFHVEISNDISSQKQRKLKIEIEDFKAFFINCLFASFQFLFKLFFSLSLSSFEINSKSL